MFAGESGRLENAPPASLLAQKIEEAMKMEARKMN
jgi:hypothetical protein